MGTAIDVELWSDDGGAGEAAIDAVMAEMHRIDRTMSPHKDDSELSRINRDAGARAGARSATRCSRLLARADELLRSSSAAPSTSPTPASASSTTTAPASGPTPSALARARARDRLAPPRRSTAAPAPCASPAPACASTSAASPRATRSTTPRAILRAPRHPPRDGQRRRRQPRHRRPPRPALDDRHPRSARRSGDVVAVLPLEDVSISTSGDYERYFDDGGERFHHLIDPAHRPLAGERAQRDRAGRRRADQRGAVEGGVRAGRRAGHAR